MGPISRQPSPYARPLRRAQTDAEAKFWNVVRNRNLDGFKFRRQHTIEPYIADFASLESRVIVELDGGQHTPEVDARRTEYLQARGWLVLRFWNNDVLTNAQGVAEAILAAVASHPSPGGRYAPATLSPEGRGSKGASAATTATRSRRLTGGVARLSKE